MHKRTLTAYQKPKDSNIANPHPQMVSDKMQQKIEKDPTVTFYKIGLTHKEPSPKMIKKLGLPKVIGVASAGVDSKGKAQFLVKFDEKRTSADLKDYPVNKPVTEWLNKNPQIEKNLQDLEDHTNIQDIPKN